MATPTRISTTDTYFSPSYGLTVHTFYSIFQVPPQFQAYLLQVVVVINSSTAAVTGVTYAGVALAKKKDSGTTRVPRTEIWYLLNPPPEGYVVVTLDTSRAITARAFLYDNVDQTTPYSADASATGESNNPSVAIISAAGEVVFAPVGIAGGQAITVTPSFTVGWSALTGGSNDAQDRLAYERDLAGAALVTPSYTISVSRGWNLLAVSIKGTVGIKYGQATLDLALGVSSGSSITNHIAAAGVGLALGLNAIGRRVGAGGGEPSSPSPSLTRPRVDASVDSVPQPPTQSMEVGD